MAGYRILGPATSGWEKCRRRSGRCWLAPSPGPTTLMAGEVPTPERAWLVSSILKPGNPAKAGEVPTRGVS
jgi:hypothetical protein